MGNSTALIRCSRCNTEKSTSLFGRSSDKRGYQRWCKPCRKEDHAKKNKYKYPIIIDLLNEIWLPIGGYETRYMVSSMGRIKSIGRHTAIGGHLNTNEILLSDRPWEGYLSVVLYRDGIKSYFKVHRLVGQHFIPNPLNLPEINHKWGIRDDNRASELEWSTKKDNINHSYKVLGHKSSFLGKFGFSHNRSKPVVCCTLGIVFGSANEASRELGCSDQGISLVCAGKKDNHKGMFFRFLNYSYEPRKQRNTVSV